MKENATFKKRVRGAIRQYREVSYSFGQGCLIAIHISLLFPLVITLVFVGTESDIGGIILPVSLYLIFQLVALYAIYERSLVRKRFHYLTIARAFIDARKALKREDGEKILGEMIDKTRAKLADARGKERKEFRFRLNAYCQALNCCNNAPA